MRPSRTRVKTDLLEPSYLPGGSPELHIQFEDILIDKQVQMGENICWRLSVLTSLL